jgi:peptide/nickel transport system substrate-binding protein
MQGRTTSSTGRAARALAGALTLALLAAGCGGTQSGDKKEGTLTSAGLTAKDGESGLAEAGDPQRGGTLVYGLEAESNGGFCLPEGQLAISGMMVVRAVYDTLTVPNAEGGYSPYLAKAVTPNDDFTSWTIELREGVKFHDGTDVDATVVKNNIDAYRGTYKGRNPLLFLFVLSNIASTKVVDDLTVQVDMTKPWSAFPAYLYSSSRMGIMAQSQLDDPKTCDRKLVGTGPFVFQSWSPNESFKAKRNPDYWQIAPDGKPYPYADAIELKPIPDPQVRVNALRSGDIDVMHTTSGSDIGGKLKDLRDDGKINLLVSEDASEPAFVQLNASKPPFDDIRMRKALASGVDWEEVNQVQNDGLPTVAKGPFAPSELGYVEDPGWPEFDLAAAKKLVKDYVADGGEAQFNLTVDPTASDVRLGQLIQTRIKKAGVTVKLIQRDQAAIIDDAIGGAYEAMTFRNFPGGDPDTNYVWWYGKDNPVNFSKYDDPEINRLLDEGRGEPDPAKRKKIYQDITRRFAEQVYEIWYWYSPWAVAETAKVHNIWGPPLPGPDATKPGKATTDDKSLQPSTGLATGHSLIGMWTEK